MILSVVDRRGMNMGVCLMVVAFDANSAGFNTIKVVIINF